VNRLFLPLLALLAALASGQALHAQILPPGQKAMAVSLVAESGAPAAGGRVSLALLMKPRPGWHGYWENPGDAGVPTRIDWRLPAGVIAGPIRYPVPKRLIVAGFMNYVFEGDHAELIDLEVPAGLAPGSILPLRATVNYLVCTDQVCVPEKAELALELKVGSGETRTAEFDRYREALPRPLGGEARFEKAGGKLRLAIPLPAALSLSDPYVFPLTLEAVNHSGPQSLSRRGDLLIVEAEAGRSVPSTLQGVLAIGGGAGLAFEARRGPVPAAGAAIASTPGESGGSGPGASSRNGGAAALLLALGGAILGGLLLNIMPCVFPILSLKALSLAKAGGDERAARREAIAYTLGLVLVCLALGAAMLALRSGGSAVGWAFQLQDPRIILLLLMLVTAIALNLAVLFELPALGMGDRLTRSGGAIGAFWTGALAAFVATPCTGPFMGAAMGAALLLPGPAALAIFAGLGLGLAIPFLLLGFVPALRRRLPKPGPWMVRFRHILSAPMFLTAAGLAWVLQRQTGADGLALGLAATAVAGFALWWAGRRRGWLALAPAALAAAVAIFLVPLAVGPAAARSGGMAGEEPFSEQRLAALRSDGRPVFVYFTADWCLTCKVNEAGVLERDEVARAFAARNVAILVGDWTRGDAAIGRFLEKQGRSGIPLYLWYPPGGRAETLPQILTVGRMTALSTDPA
jgi:DsbC/DsbD-like thiol-disulfide interchange protein/cytochrome c biogenesis protein CcdA